MRDKRESLRPFKSQWQEVSWHGRLSASLEVETLLVSDFDRGSAGQSSTAGVHGGENEGGHHVCAFEPCIAGVSRQADSGINPQGLRRSRPTGAEAASAIV